MMRFGLLLVLAAGSMHGIAYAQDPQIPLRVLSTPGAAGRIRQMVTQSGLTPEQIRARLSAAGYPADLLDGYMPGATGSPGSADPNQLLQAAQAIGFDTDAAGNMAVDSVSGEPGESRRDLPAARPDTEAVFGLEVFRRVSSQFQPAAAGPVDPSYRLGPGDAMVLILTGDVELAHSLEVTREGFIVIPQVGQVNVAGLTMSQLESVLYQRLGRVYSGVRRGPGATTHFQTTVTRLRTNQVFVIGDVVKPGSYQVSSAGTVLSALYLAGGPTAAGSFRHIEIRRGGQLIDSLDLYDYLLRGNNRHDVRLESGDVVFVPVRRLPVEVGGEVVRPAIYELRPGETLTELIDMAGGFEAQALRRRIQIDRILPPAQREAGGRDRVVLEITEEHLAGPAAPGVTMAAGDRVTVFGVAPRRRNSVTVTGNVWMPGPLGFTPGMTLGEAIRLAGGPKPDSYLGRVLVSRLRSDSTRGQLRAELADSTGAVRDDFPLREDDEVTVFSRTAFRPDRYVVVTGAVNRPGRIRYREGMTLRDAVLEANGVREDALLTEAEVARMPEDRSGGVTAASVRVALDSTYLFDRGRDGSYQGPPGIDTRPGGAPEFTLAPYDNVLILRQPDWELPRQVTLAGEVRYPGSYTLRSKSERLVDIITRAGGLTDEAYARGAELYRQQPMDGAAALDLVTRLEATRTDSTADRPDQLGASLARRVGLDLAAAIERPRSGENLILQSGDSIVVPRFRATVQVLGAVSAPTTVIFQPGWNLDRYVAAAGGYSRTADQRRAYVVQPGGKLQSVTRRFLLADGKPKPLPGAVVVVPERDPADKKDWAGFLGSLAQVLASTVAIVAIALR